MFNGNSEDEKAEDQEIGDEDSDVEYSETSDEDSLKLVLSSSDYFI